MKEMDMTEVTKEQIDGLRELAEALSGKKLGNIKDPVKLQAIVDLARAEKEEEAAKVESPLTKQKKRQKAREDAMKLVRVRITPMSPYYKQMTGAMFAAGNSLVGDVKRYVQFEDEWHVEQILLNVIQNKRYRTKVEKRDPTTRRMSYENKFHKAFGVEILPPLTKEEIKDLAQAQQARASID